MLPAVVPRLAAYFRRAIVALAVIGIVYGAILAIGQTDVMRLIAYTSISHFGFIILGIFVMTSQGQSGSTLYMVNHGISTAALFLIAGFLVSRRGTGRSTPTAVFRRWRRYFAGTFLVAAWPPCRCPGWLRSSVSSWSSSARSPALPDVRGVRRLSPGAVRDLRVVDVPADDDRPLTGATNV